MPMLVNRITKVSAIVMSNTAMMRRIATSAAGFLIVGALVPATAVAGSSDEKTYWEQQVGQWSDPRMAPETQTECKSVSKGSWPWGGKWEACKQWDTRARVMEVKSTLYVRGPKGVSKSDKKLVEKCGAFAAYSIAQIKQENSAPNWATAATTFQLCAANAKLEAPFRFTVNVETQSSWSKWH